MVYLVLQGVIQVVYDGSWHVISISRRHGNTDAPHADPNAHSAPNIRLGSHVQTLAELQEQMSKEAKKMLLYPCAYAITVLPQTIVRWAVRVNLQTPIQDRPFGATGAAISIFGLSGFINVVLFLSTRPSLFRLGNRGRPRAQSNPGSCSHCAPLRAMGQSSPQQRDADRERASFDNLDVNRVTPTRIMFLRESSSSSSSRK